MHAEYICVIRNTLLRINVNGADCAARLRGIALQIVHHSNQRPCMDESYRAMRGLPSPADAALSLLWLVFR
jgi:hypothetical protein